MRIAFQSRKSPSLRFEIILSDSGREGDKGYSEVHYFRRLADCLEGASSGAWTHASDVRGWSWINGQDLDSPAI